MTETELIEQLADKEHASWARWMDYLLNKFDRAPNGDVVLPAGYVAALQAQIDTPYSNLTETEKQYDRDEVAHILPIIRKTREAAYDEIQEYVVAHAFDTTVGRKIDDFITERLKALASE